MNTFAKYLIEIVAIILCISITSALCYLDYLFYLEVIKGDIVFDGYTIFSMIILFIIELILFLLLIYVFICSVCEIWNLCRRRRYRQLF